MAKFDIPFDIALSYDTRQLNDMKFQDLQRTAAALAREARQRVKDLTKAEKTLGRSPALAKYEEWRLDKGQGAYSARYKGRNALMQEITDLKNFLDDETGTVEGYKEFIKKFDEKFDIESTKEDRKEFWDIYNKHLESLSQTSAFYSSDRIQEDLKTFIRDLAVSEMDSEGNERRVIPWATIRRKMAEKLPTKKLKK